ncbi:amidohydrolase family protein [Streptomyces sp. NPDC001410]|uniref:amidohydrolase family protein n=1 Tax=Streptomyces sp. NPDC001410 TaxID=3364574 RepID=UPI0036799453
MALGLRGHEDTSTDTVAEELKLAAELGLRTSVHTGSDGTARSVADLREHGLLRDTTTFVHGNGIDDDELRMLAEAGSSVSISPDVGLKRGFGRPLTGRVLAAGLRPTLSVDDVPAAGGDMFSTMRTAYAVQRCLDGGLRSRDLLEFATVDGAQACGLGARTGSITPGKDADVILLRADDLTVFPVSDPAATIVSAGHPGLVDTVLVAGRILKRDGVLVGRGSPGAEDPTGGITQSDRGGRRHTARRYVASAAGIGVAVLGPTASVADLVVTTDTTKDRGPSCGKPRLRVGAPLPGW